MKDGEAPRRKAPPRALAEEDVQALIEKVLADRKLPLENLTRARYLRNVQNFESPFSEEIEKADPPRWFSIPKLRVYDGISDPAYHVQHY